MFFVGDAVSGKKFQFCSDKGKNSKTLDSVDVAVSAMLYVPQLASLVVGYNFGGFQIWNLMTLEVE